MIFFYVDDIVVAYEKKKELQVEKVMSKLMKRYELTGGSDLQWFLGMEVSRNRDCRVSWLTQKLHLEKLGKDYGARTQPKTPMTQEELLPYEGSATSREIKLYQRKVGSLLYVGVTTRPDVAFAVSRLARFLTNPGPLHQKAADRVIAYLFHTRELALHFGRRGHLGGCERYVLRRQHA